MDASDFDRGRNDVNFPIDEGWWASILSEEDKVRDFPGSRDNGVYTPPAEKSTTHTDWGIIHQLYENDEVITLDVESFNRGGLLVKREHIHGFVPVSHLMAVPVELDPELRDEYLAEYIGKEISLKVIEFDPCQERIVFSERAALAGTGKRKALMESIQPGSALTGVVTNITDFGVFIDLGGLEGLIHVSELSWGKVQDPRAVVRIDEQVNVIVLNVNEQNERVALSLKRCTANPWHILEEKFKEGATLPAQVASIARFGVFARLDLGVEGLIHKSSLSADRYGSDLQSHFPAGKPISVKILHIDCERHRLGLGLIED